jgi:hypothetical protein
VNPDSKFTPLRYAFSCYIAARFSSHARRGFLAEADEMPELAREFSMEDPGSFVSRSRDRSDKRLIAAWV